MEQLLYLGSLAIRFRSEAAFPLQQWDAKFLTPVLPVTAQAYADLTFTDRLSIPEGHPHEVRGMKIWNTDDGEYRLYHAPKEVGPYLLSHRQDNTVHILARRDGWGHDYQSFRPWFHIHVEELLLQNRALVLHSASIIYRGQAIAFTAPSGTGKTTQTDLWHQYRSDVADLNGDRTLLQWTPDGWYGCGFPVFGSTVRCEQAAAPLGAIVIVRQSPTDRVRELTMMEKVTLLYSEITVPAMSQETIGQAMDLIETLAAQVKVLQLDCTMNESAVDVLHRYLFGE